jgi:hypothetical protein
MPSIEQQPSGLEVSKEVKLKNSPKDTFERFKDWSNDKIERANAQIEKLKNSLFSSERAGIAERWRNISNNPEAKEALAALARLGINISFTVADMVPGAGEVMAPALNTFKTASKFIPSLKPFDPTKDVGIGESIGFEILSSPAELASLGTAPTYLLNTLRQTWADYKAGNFSKAKDVVGYLISGKDGYPTSLKEKSSKLDAAAGLFKK